MIKNISVKLPKAWVSRELYIGIHSIKSVEMGDTETWISSNFLGGFYLSQKEHRNWTKENNCYMNMLMGGGNIVEFHPSILKGFLGIPLLFP